MKIEDVSSAFHSLQPKTQGRGHSLFEQPRPLIVSRLLLAVADAIDRAGPIVGNEDRTILGEEDIGGTAEIALISLDPARRENLLLGFLAVGTCGDAHDAPALVLMPVPGAVLGDQDRVLVVGGELLSGIELHS